MEQKKLRVIGLITIWIFMIIMVIFLIYFMKNIEFIKGDPCGACENLTNKICIYAFPIGG